MENVFLDMISLSLKAGCLVLMVLLLRILMKKAPRYIHCGLWIMVFARLLCPVSFESSFSLIPDVLNTVSDTFDYSQSGNIDVAADTGGSSLDEATAGTTKDTTADIVTDTVKDTAKDNSYGTATDRYESTDSANSGAINNEAGAIVNDSNELGVVKAFLHFGSLLWLPVAAMVLIYAFVCYIRLRRRVNVSMRVCDNIWCCDDIDTPFILGVIKPKIYIPSGITEEQLEYVTEHEMAHLRRFDHLLKPLAFLLAAVYWFNPLVWAAYILFSHDIELACDERVIRDMNLENKKAYSDALLSLSIARHGQVASSVFAVSPLAFGEIGVKKRIKNVLNYKKPALWIIVASIAACLTVGLCFLTNPLQTNITPELDAAVSATILKENNYEKTNGTFGCEAHDVLAISKSGGQVTVYAMVLTEEFGQKDGKPESISACHFPVALTFDVGDNDSYSITEYWIPEDGNGYESSIKGKFPIKAWKKALDTQKYIDAQYDDCYKQAEEYFAGNSSNVRKDAAATDGSKSGKGRAGASDSYFEAAKTYLASFANSSDELAKAGCLVISHEKLSSGLGKWNDFIDAVNAGNAAELVIAQFTVEGDTILDYLKYDGSGFYHVNDYSRDKFSGEGDGYLQDSYPYIKLYDNVMRNGDKSRQIVLTSDNNMTFEEYNELVNSDDLSSDEASLSGKASFRRIAYVADGLGMKGTDEDAGMAEVSGDGNEPGTSGGSSDMLLAEDDVTKIVVTNGNTGEQKTFAVTDGMHTYLDIMTLYNKLELKPSDEELRSGYGCRMDLFDYKDKRLQTVTPYKDVIMIDDKMYEYSSDSIELFLMLSELF